MAGIKRIWKAAVKQVRVHLTHQYTGNVLIGMEYRARVLLRVTEGPGVGREIEVWFTREEALDHAERVIKAVEEADERNKLNS